MKPKTSIILACITLALITGTISGKSRSKKTRVPKKWEYKFLDCTVPLEYSNKLGAEGWEMVTVASTSSQCVIYFKRPKITRYVKHTKMSGLKRGD